MTPLPIPPRSEVRQRPIETNRLLLVPVEITDGSELWFAVDGSRSVLGRWLPWVEYTGDPSAALRFAEACASDWDQGRALRFAIRERASRTFLGIVGLENLVHLHRNAELGYWLRQDAQKRGIMTEASRAVLDFGFGALGLHRVKVAAATDNHPSLAVIHRLQFRFEGMARQAEWCAGRWLDHANFALVGSDWAHAKLAESQRKTEAARAAK